MASDYRHALAINVVTYEAFIGGQWKPDDSAAIRFTTAKETGMSSANTRFTENEVRQCAR